MKWLCTVLLLLSAQALAATPESVQVSYVVSMSGIQAGKIDENYNRNGELYTITSITTPLGLLAMFKPGKVYLNSRGQLTGQGLKPLHFEDKREDNPEKNTSAEFNWQTRQLTLTRQSGRSALELPAGTQDRLSAMYQFMFLELKNGDTLNFSMTNGNKLDSYHYLIGQHEKLATPAGSFDTIYLDSQIKPGESRTEIWLSSEYKLPCKVIITESNGNQYTQILGTLKTIP